MKNGVPYDVAFGMDPTFMLAHVAVLGEFEGNVFNWKNLTFEKRN